MNTGASLPSFPRELWRLVRLFGAGIVWLVPFALTAGLDQDVARYPHLADIVAHAELPLFFVTSILCVGGILVVSRLSRPAPPLGEGSAKALVAFVALPVLVALIEYILSLVDSLAFQGRGAPRGSDSDLMLWLYLVPLAGMIVAVAVTALVGLGVTTATLWRRAWWLGLVVLGVWVFLTGIVLFGTRNLTDNGVDGGEGFAWLAGCSVQVVVAIIAALVVFIVTGARSKPAGLIEQAVQPDNARSYA